MPTKKQLKREELVHDRMVRRWAVRYLEIEHKHGEATARMWVDAFLNAQDVPRVAQAVSSVLLNK